MRIERVCFVAKRQAELDALDRMINEVASAKASDMTIMWLVEHRARLELMYVQPRIILTEREFEAMHGGHA